MKHLKQHEKLVSQNKMFQQQVFELLKLNLDNQENNEDWGNMGDGFNSVLTVFD